jgi:predicted LPLAT superfamily acyltransferase
MAHLLTLLAENIFVVIGFALYTALVYYMITRTLRKRFGKDYGKKDEKKNTGRKNFARHVVSNNPVSGNDFSS